MAKHGSQQVRQQDTTDLQTMIMTVIKLTRASRASARMLSRDARGNWRGSRCNSLTRTFTHHSPTEVASEIHTDFYCLKLTFYKISLYLKTLLLSYINVK